MLDGLRGSVVDVWEQTISLEQRDHRPWPLPARLFRMGQTWRNQLFAHWPVDAALLRPYLPDSLAIDEHSGSAWVSITPFEVTGLHLPIAPPLPGLSRYTEVNVRTYVTHGGKAGIWFLSLDASHQLLAAAAAWAYKLPYFVADMELETLPYGDEVASLVEFSSVRRGTAPGHAPHGDGDPTAGLSVACTYAPRGDSFGPAPGTLEHFLTERYCLYALHDGALHVADVHHRPWSLQSAEATFTVNNMAWCADDPALAHYAERQDVLIWGLERVEYG